MTTNPTRLIGRGAVKKIKTVRNVRSEEMGLPWLSKSGWDLGGCSAKSVSVKRSEAAKKKRKGKIPQSQCAFVKPCFLCLRVVFVDVPH